MSDAELRALERRFRETRSVDDGAAFLSHAVRVGKLSRDAVALAASFGQPSAARVVPDAPKIPFVELPRVVNADEPFVNERRFEVSKDDAWVSLVSAGPVELRARVLLPFARAVLPRWPELVPSCPTWGERTVARAETWLGCPCAEHAEAAGRAEPDDPAREELRTGGYARTNTLADKSFYAYKEGVTGDLAAHRALSAPGGVIWLSSISVPGNRGPALVRRLVGGTVNEAAYVVGPEAILARARADLIPWLLRVP